jgi:hypothetical protein
MDRTDPTEILCMNSTGDAPVYTMGASQFGGNDGSTSSGRSDTNIIRSRIVPKVTCGSLTGVLATRSETSVCGRTLSSLAQMGSLIFLLDYHGGWSCLPKWEQALNEHQEQ